MRGNWVRMHRRNGSSISAGRRTRSAAQARGRIDRRPRGCVDNCRASGRDPGPARADDGGVNARRQRPPADMPRWPER